MDNEELNLVFGMVIGAFIIVALLFFFGISSQSTAEFVCESHGLELIDYEIKSPTFSKVECGNKKPELQYENYKVFTK